MNKGGCWVQRRVFQHRRLLPAGAFGQERLLLRSGVGVGGQERLLLRSGVGASGLGPAG